MNKAVSETYITDEHEVKIPRYVIAEAVRTSGEFLWSIPVLDLSPGHHHVHVAEDGTITAVPMRRLRANNIGIGWVDAPTGGDA